MRKVWMLLKSLVVVVAVTVVLDITGLLPEVMRPAVHAVERRASQQVEQWWADGAPVRAAGEQVQGLARQALAHMAVQRGRLVKELDQRYSLWLGGEERAECR